jgi:hypothetical protein
VTYSRRLPGRIPEARQPTQNSRYYSEEQAFKKANVPDEIEQGHL